MMLSSTLIFGKTDSCWKVRPIPSLLRSQARLPATGWPLTKTSPEVGGYWPRMQLKSVDLPEPFGPISPRISPG